MKEIVVLTEIELAEVASEILKYCEGRRKFAVTGEMGVGKTTLIKKICSNLGAEKDFSSPTYSLINHYMSGKVGEIYHIDLYRIEQIDQALDIGIEDYLYDANYCFIEWPGLIEQLLPEQVVKIDITVGEDHQRIIRIKK